MNRRICINMLQLFWISVLTLNFGSCAGENFVQEEEQQKEFKSTERKSIELSIDSKNTSENLRDFYTRMTADVLSYDKELNNDENVVISPLSIGMLLGMTANGLSKNYQELICDYMNVTDINISNGFFKSILNSIPECDDLAVLGIANSFWINHGYSLCDEFNNTLSNQYDAEVISSDFSSSGIVSEINNWCSENSNIVSETKCKTSD